MKKNSGITLIALIITIVVMIILVAVTVNIVINSGLLDTTKRAGDDYKTAMDTESHLGEEAQFTYDGYQFHSIEELNRYLKDGTLPEGAVLPDIDDVLDNGYCILYTEYDDDEFYEYNGRYYKITWDDNAQDYTNIEISSEAEINPIIANMSDEKLIEAILNCGNNLNDDYYYFFNKYYEVTYDEGTDSYTAAEEVTDENTIAVLETAVKQKRLMAEVLAHREDYGEEVGIGTDGSIVDMSLWAYNSFSIDDVTKTINLCNYEGSSNQLPAYIGNFSNGEIIGTVPQYIMPVNKTEFYTVTGMDYTFINYTGLTIAPEIPSTVTSMAYTFADCTALTTAPVIKDTVTYALGTFKNCSSLTGDLVINANPSSSYTWCLEGAATNNGCNLKLSGTSTMLNEILETKSTNSHISLK